MIKIFGLGSKEELEQIEEDESIQEELEPEVGQIAVDILETPIEMIILAPIAGIDISDIDLSCKNGTLIIRGERQHPLISTDDIKFRVSECFWGNFVRNIILPDNLDLDSIRASMENNLLKISIRKYVRGTSHIEIDKIDF